MKYSKLNYSQLPPNYKRKIIIGKKRIINCFQIIFKDSSPVDETSKPADENNEVTTQSREDQSQQSTPVMSINSSRAIIYKSEMDYISRCILDYPNIETGGQLFGYWTESGVPVVVYAIGPGSHANHQATFFNQDLDYLVRVGNRLKSQYGLHHIGEWHSHHRLGLAKPSGHDANTMCSTIRSKNLGRFLLCIGNCNDTSTTLNPFLCDDSTYSKSTWDIIDVENVMRRSIDSSLSDILIHPRTQRACHMENRLNAGENKVKFQNNYWLNIKENASILNDMMNYVKRLSGKESTVKVQMDGQGLVHIVARGYNKFGHTYEDNISFPQNFPNEAPVIRRTVDGVSNNLPTYLWCFDGNIYNSFREYYYQTR